MEKVLRPIQGDESIATDDDGSMDAEDLWAPLLAMLASWELWPESSSAIWSAGLSVSTHRLTLCSKRSKNVMGTTVLPSGSESGSSSSFCTNIGLSEEMCH